MRLTLLLCLLLFLSSGCEKKEKPPMVEEATQESLLETISTFNNAFRTADIAVLDSLTTENYSHSNGTSKAIGKREWMDYLRKRKADLDSGKLKVNRYAMAETNIEMSKNIAVVTAKISVSSEVEGEVRENEYRVSNFWIYEVGSWKRAGFHDGKIK